MSKETLPDLNTNIKRRIDYRFYTNVTTVTVTGEDAYIDFMQYPPENNEVPTVRIYLSLHHIKSLSEVFKQLPQTEEKKK